MWQLSRTYKELPSALLRIEDDLAAYCFDRAVSLFGHAVEADIDAAIEGKDRKVAQAFADNVVAKWTEKPMKFASPVPTRGR